MFERFLIDISNQWVPTTLGSLLQASVFYGKISLVTPLTRLSSLIRSNKEAINILNHLIDTGNLEIEIEQFPAGEVALCLGLINDRISQLKETSDYDIPLIEEMVQEYGDRDRIAAELIWDFSANKLEGKYPSKKILASIKKLVDSLKMPSIDEEYISTKKALLQKTLQYCSESSLLNISLEVHGDADSARISFIDKESEGINFKALAYNNETAAEYLEAISLSAFIVDHGTNDNYHDLFTTDKFNAALKNIYSKDLERIALNGGVNAFQDVVVGIGRIADLFDAGELEFTKLVPVIEAKGLLLDAVKNKLKDKNIIEWYFNEANIGAFSGTMAKKAVRFGFFTAPGILLDVLSTGGIGTALGVGIGAFDSLFLDKLAKKRGPTTFVDDYLKPLGKS